MKTSIAFSIALHWVNQLVSIFIEGSACSLEIFTRLSEIVIIYEVIASVIRRINVNHLDSTKIVFAENFKNIKVIALYIKILGVPKIYGSIEVRTESFVGSLICKARRGTLIRPRELIAFFGPVEQVLRQLVAELVEVDGKFGGAALTYPLSETLRKQRGYFCHIVICCVKAFHS